MSILSTSSRLIKVGQDYSAGSGISIDNHIISVTSIPGTTYSAGENITIEDNIINSKDWSQDIADASANAYESATAQIPAPFDPSYISGQIDNKLDSTAFTAWQSGQYATDLQTIEGQIANKLDESAFSEVSASFLTAINIPESATWNEVSQAYEQASGTYLTEVSIPESATWQDVSTTVQTNSATWGQGGGTGGDEEVNSFVYNNSANILEVDSTYQENSASYLTSHQDISYKLDTTAFSTVSGDFLTAAPADMATTGDVADLAQSVSETYQVKGDYLTTADSANFYPANNPSSFATENWVTGQGYITGVDLSEYAKRDFVLSSIESATSGKLDVSSFASISGDFLTNEDLNGYATESFVENVSGDITALIPDTSNFITNSSAEATYQTIDGMTAYQPIGNYATETLIEETSGAITSLIPTDYYPDSNPSSFATEDWVTGQGYITGVSIPESATWNDVSTTVQTNSAQWAQGGGGGGDAEVNSFVYNNSANILDVDTSYQTNSGIYLKTNEFYPTIGRGLTGGGFGLAVGSYSKSFNYGLGIGEYANRYVTNARSNAAIGYSAHAYGTGSQAFGEQVVVSGGMAIGSNNKTSACSFVIGNGTSNTARSDIFVINYDGSVSAAGKISANGVELGAGGAGNPEVENYVQTNSAQIDDTVTSYQTNSSTFLTAHQAISAEEWNSNYETVNTNSGAWGGDALPITGRDGIDLEIDNGTLYIGASALTGYVAQSAFDELKQNYDSLSSLVAAHSASWS